MVHLIPRTNSIRRARCEHAALKMRRAFNHTRLCYYSQAPGPLARSRCIGTTAAPFIREAAALTAPYTVTVIGAPLCYGQQLEGPERAPAALRAAGIRAAVTASGWRLVDAGDVVITTPRAGDVEADHARNAYAVGRSAQAISARVADAARQGHFVLTLGGDHSVALGTVSGVLAARPTAGILWVDAHADINDPATSPTGNLHGMPLSLLMGLVAPSAVPGFEWMASAPPPLLPRSLVYVGLRDLDGGEKAVIRRLGIKAFTMHDIDRHGIGKVGGVICSSSSSSSRVRARLSSSM